MNNPYYVYIIIDYRTNQPMYVGKGKDRRMYDHKANAYNPNKFNKHPQFYNHIKDIINGGGELIYEKVLINVDETSALNSEKEWISKIGRIDLDTGPLYNRTGGGEGQYHLTPEERRNRQLKSSKPVSQYDKQGQFIQTFESAKCASEVIEGANQSYITQCCKGKRKSAGGFMWTYEGEDAPTPYRKQYNKYVNQYEKDGSFVKQWDSLSEAAEFYGVNVRTISHAIHGRSKTCKGYVWKLA